MKFKPTRRNGCARATGGFTLVEVLAALLFMAIVIPTAIEGLRIASLAGQVGQRKAMAARVAESMLNELVITRQWQTGAPSGVVEQGATEFEWRTRIEPWLQQSVLRQLTVEVTFPVQGREYDVRLSTLVNQ